MSRLQPYRSRIPTHIIKLLDVSSRITLFLVGQNGPLSFIFKDRLQNKYKTLIGSQINCSCSPNKNDHCIHSLYVLLKIFKISVQNPIIWQASYIDSELSDIISGKHTVLPPRQRIARPNFEIHQQMQILPSDFYIRKQKKPKFLSSAQEVKPLDLQLDSVCPICQQEMNKNMCLTHCKAGCGNNYHLQCLKVWISHKKNQQAKITCPMCRQQFHPGIFQEIKYEESEWKKKEMIKKSHKFKCHSCGLQQIPKNAHKCILCQKFTLCEACYMGNKHIKHPFMKRNQLGEWQAGQQRRPSELKIKEFIDGKRKQSKNKEILQKLRESKKLSLLDFICSAYPYVSKYISDNIDPYKKLNLQPESMECFKCGSKRMIFLRRLPCGHFIDHQCLKENIRKGVTYCEKDGDKLVKGYENMLEQQREMKYEEEKIELQVQVQGGFVGGEFSEQYLNNSIRNNNNQQNQIQQPLHLQSGQILNQGRRSYRQLQRLEQQRLHLGYQNDHNQNYLSQLTHQMPKRQQQIKSNSRDIYGREESTNSRRGPINSVNINNEMIHGLYRIRGQHYSNHQNHQQPYERQQNIHRQQESRKTSQIRRSQQKKSQQHTNNILGNNRIRNSQKSRQRINLNRMFNNANPYPEHLQYLNGDNFNNNLAVNMNTNVPSRKSIKRESSTSKKQKYSRQRQMQQVGVMLNRNNQNQNILPNKKVNIVMHSLLPQLNPEALKSNHLSIHQNSKKPNQLILNSNHPFFAS